jgi:uncharacterized protein (TIRG00374 family)
LKTSWAFFIQGNVTFYILATVLFLIFLLICNLRWKILLDSQGVFFTFWYLFKVYLLSWFFNNILPTTIGGDVLRIAYTVPQSSSSTRPKTAQAFAGTFVDRFVGFIGLFFFAFVVYFGWLANSQDEKKYLGLVIAGFLTLTVLLGVFFSRRIYSFLSRSFKKFTLFNLGAKIDKAYSSIQNFRSALKELTLSFMLSLFVQLSLALVWYFCGLGISVRIPLKYYLFYIPIIGVITMIPISIGGLGVRENLFVSIFSLKGITKDEAGAISLLYLLVNFIYALVGGITFLFLKKEHKISNMRN